MAARAGHPRVNRFVAAALCAFLAAAAVGSAQTWIDPAGTATGTLTLNGVATPLTHAYASVQPGFFDKQSDDIRMLLSSVPLDDVARADMFALGRQPSAVVLRASQRLIESGGCEPIASVLADVGCSQKHLIAQFKSEIGLTPKRLARVLRFGRAVDRLRAGKVDLAALALDCGYYDQPHFDRDFKSFAGLSPSALLASALPSGGFAADVPEVMSLPRR